MSRIGNLVNILQESATQSHYNPVYLGDGFDMNESAAFLAVEFNNINRELNERHGAYIDDYAGLLVESAKGGSPDYDALEEGFIADIGAKIVAGYKRLIEMVKGVLAKIQSFLDGMTKSGAALVSKYKNKIVSDRSKFEYEGFDWIKNIESAVSYQNPCDWMPSQSVGKFSLGQIYTGGTPTMYPSDVRELLETEGGEKNGNPTQKAKDAEKRFRDQLKDLEANTDMNSLKVRYATAVVKGLSLESYSRLGEALHKYFRGRADKHTIKGLSVISFDEVCTNLEKGKDFTAISDLYDDMKKALEESLRKVENIIRDWEKEKDDEEGRVRDAKSLQIDFLKKAVSIANDLDAVASTINNAALSAAKAKHEECRIIFTKLMSYNPSKKQNNSAVDLLDEAFEIASNDDNLGILAESACMFEY